MGRARGEARPARAAAPSSSAEARPSILPACLQTLRWATLWALPVREREEAGGERRELCLACCTPLALSPHRPLFCPPALLSSSPPPPQTDAKMVRVEPYRVTIAGGKGGQARPALHRCAAACCIMPRAGREPRLHPPALAPASRPLNTPTAAGLRLRADIRLLGRARRPHQVQHRQRRHLPTPLLAARAAGLPARGRAAADQGGRGATERGGGCAWRAVRWPSASPPP